MPKSNNYWQDRFNKLQESQLKKGETYYKSLEKQYKIAMRDIEKDMSVWYKRFANNNQITFADAKQMLSANQLSEFKWDVHEYIKYGEQNALDQSWMKELENASARVHLSRLEALKIQTQQSIEKLYGSHMEGMTTLGKNIYADGYYHTAFEIQSGFNVGYDLQKLNEKQLTQVISKPWAADGQTFSDRIWTSKRKMINTLHTELTQAVIRGDSEAKVIKAITKQFGVDRNAAGRLVMTESAFFSSASQRDAFNSLDVERFEIVATLDNSTSEICQGLDGQVFKMDDYEVGSTAPPFHPWCRSCTVPYFDDNGGERIAKGADGKTYFVPSNTTYPEWKKTFVDKTMVKSDIMKNTPVIPNAAPLTFKDKIQTIKDNIAANSGIVTEDDMQAAGTLIMDDLKLNRVELKSTVDDLQKQMQDLGMDKIDADMLKISSVRRRLRDPSELGLSDDHQLSDKLNEMNFELLKKKSEIQPLHDELKTKLNIAKTNYQGKTKDNAQELKDKLSEIRSIGTGSNDMNAHFNKSRSPMKAVVTDAYEYYPTDWVNKSVKNGSLTPKKVDRGYYSHFGGEIAISGSGGDGSFKTAVHELGHRFEKTIGGMLDSQKFFYERRTAGEALEWLGGRYAYSEKSRFDKFIEKYIGKDYKGTAYEVVSMGFQYAYTDPVLLWTDEDYATYIYGMLALL